MTSAERIKAVLKKRGWSQAQLAKQINYSTQNLSRKLRDEKEVDIELAIDVSRALGISIDYIYGISQTVSLVGLLSKHIKPCCGTDVPDGKLSFSGFEVSKPLLRYFDDLYRAENSNAPEDLRMVWLERIETKFISELYKDDINNIELNVSLLNPNDTLD